jgi:integrase
MISAARYWISSQIRGDCEILDGRFAPRTIIQQLIPPRLLAHLRRGKDRKRIANCFVEFNSKPVVSVKRGFKTAVGLARPPGKVTPHTLRHTAATWLMQRGVPIWEAAGFLGMSPEILQDTYGHHHPDYLQGAAAAIGQKGRHVSVLACDYPHSFMT